MEVWEILKISQEDYNTALFEAGCITAENFYGPADAIKIKHQAGYWKWLREQNRGCNLHTTHQQRPIGTWKETVYNLL